MKKDWQIKAKKEELEKKHKGYCEREKNQLLGLGFTLSSTDYRRRTLSEQILLLNWVLNIKERE